MYIWGARRTSDVDKPFSSNSFLSSTHPHNTHTHTHTEHTVTHTNTCTHTDRSLKDGGTVEGKEDSIKCRMKGEREKQKEGGAEEDKERFEGGIVC